MCPRFDRKLAVITHVQHWLAPDGQAYAYEPYVREMRVWADLFAQVEICAPSAEGPMRGILASYGRGNISWEPVSYSKSYRRLAPVRRAVQMPGLVRSVHRRIVKSDLVLLRSPGHPALVGHLLVRWMHKPSITKWAGEFGAYAGERLPSRLERALLSRARNQHPVLVYGPGGHPDLISFLPALMSTEELGRAARLSSDRSWSPPWKLLSVGRLEPVKGFELAVEGLGELRRRCPELDWEYTLVGDGSSMGRLRTLSRKVEIAERVFFAGALPFSEVQKQYAGAHVAIMPGTKEGWPKIIAEAWAHGVVPVAASDGLVPWILREEGAGEQFEPTPAGLARTVANLLSNPARVRAMSGELMCRAAELSLDRFRSRLEQVLVERCGLG